MLLVMPKSGHGDIDRTSQKAAFEILIRLSPYVHRAKEHQDTSPAMAQSISNEEDQTSSMSHALSSGATSLPLLFLGDCTL